MASKHKMNVYLDGQSSSAETENETNLLLGEHNGFTILPKLERGDSSRKEHCHTDADEPGIDRKARKKLVIASILCLFFMIGEIAGGALAHSLAIMTDAAHLLTDFASFMISLLALFLAARPSTKKMSFGWHRAEVVGALASVLMIWLVTGILVYLAVMRIIHAHYEINGKIMLITSAVGVGVNIIMVLTLHDHGHGHGGSGGSHDHSGHSHGEIEELVVTDRTTEPHLEDGLSQDHSHATIHSHGNNGAITISKHAEEMKRRQNITVRAALIHVIGDLLQSIGVMIAAMIIYFKPSFKVVDPICTFLFSVLVLITTINILRDALNVLMEATPKTLNFNEVKNALYGIPGVLEVHNLRMWSLTVNKTAISVHLAIDKNTNSQEILDRASKLLRTRYLFHDMTIQLEEYVAEMADCRKCQEPKL